MNSFPLISPGRRGSLALLTALVLVGGAGLAIAQSKSEAKASVAVKVDTSPLPKNADTTLTFSPIVKRVAPSVVRVETTEIAQADNSRRIVVDPFFGPMVVPPNGRMPQEPVQQGVGSGVIVSTDGYILTNNHVVSGADKLKVIMTDGRELPATVVGTDERTDVAVIKVNAKDLPAVTFAESANIEVGDRVLAIGNPFGLGQTVTTGIVSAKDRQIGILNQTDRRSSSPGAQQGYEDFIQTDAAINPGNSGGALVDMQGRLVGINTAILSGSGGSNGAGFAIPSDLARSVMNSLVRDGKVVRGYLGVSPKDFTPALAEYYKTKESKGAIIVEVVEGSPAEKAGIKNDDIIVSLNGKAVTDSQRLRLLIANSAPGEEVKLGVIRDGKDLTISAKVGELDTDRVASSRTRGPRGNAAAAKPESRLDGVAVMDLTNRLRNEFSIPGNIRSGAVVTEVDPNSAAADAGLAAGDVILEIDRKPVKNADEAIKLTEDYGNGKTLLRIFSRGATNLLAVDEANSQPAQQNPGRRLFGR